MTAGNKASSGKVIAGQLVVGSSRATSGLGGGTPVTGIYSGALSLTPGAVTTNTRVATTGTITGASVNDYVAVIPSPSIEAGLAVVGAHISAANTVTVQIHNNTGGTVTGLVHADFRYVLIKFT